VESRDRRVFCGLRGDLVRVASACAACRFWDGRSCQLAPSRVTPKRLKSSANRRSPRRGVGPSTGGGRVRLVDVRDRWPRGPAAREEGQFEGRDLEDAGQLGSAGFADYEPPQLPDENEGEEELPELQDEAAAPEEAVPAAVLPPEDPGVGKPVEVDDTSPGQVGLDIGHLADAVAEDELDDALPGMPDDTPPY